MIDKDIAILHESKRAEQALDYVGAELTRRENAVIAKVMELLDDGRALDPSLAVQYWMEVKAFRGLRRSLESKATQGRSAAERLGKNLT
jgi:hypothetical protein